MRGSEREKQVPRKKEADWLARERDGGMVEGEMGGGGAASTPPLNLIYCNPVTWKRSRYKKGIQLLAAICTNGCIIGKDCSH